MATIDDVNTLLCEAAYRLDEASKHIAEDQVLPIENIRKIGRALAEIYDIQAVIYQSRPDLTPKILRDDPRNC